VASRGVAFRTRTATEALSYSETAAGVFSPFISAVGILDGGLTVTGLEGASATAPLDSGLAVAVLDGSSGAGALEGALALSVIE
jgi:hypothetical protein